MKHKVVFFVISFMLGMMSCKDDSEIVVDADAEDVTSHTSLAYIVADNSLDSYADDDIDEMVDGFNDIDDTANYHMLIYVDDSSSPLLMQIIKEDGVAVLDTIKTYEEVNSLYPDTMASIINYALALYPADTYGLTLWSHGSGWLPGTDQSTTEETTRAFGVDDNNDVKNQDEGTQMDILDLKTALEACEHFSYIMFDACNMQSIEVAYELRDCADYFIASPGEIPAYGAPYDEVVPAFFTEENTADAIAEAYYEPYAESYSYTSGSGTARSTKSGGSGYYDGGTSESSAYQYGIAISVVDASYLDDLASATQSILTAYVADSATITTSGILSYDDNYYNFFYDLDGFIKTLTDSDSEYTSWKEIFDEAVPAFYTTDYIYSSYANDGDGGMASMSDASGVATFVPNNDNFLDATYWAYYLNIAKLYPQYSYLTEIIEEYEEYYQEYYKNFEWDTDAGWSSIGW